MLEISPVRKSHFVGIVRPMAFRRGGRQFATDHSFQLILRDAASFGVALRVKQAIVGW